MGKKLSVGQQLSPRSILIWRIVQVAVWLVGVAILYCLFFYPKMGIALFWNILIPVAPALLVISTGLWRNICPLATTNLLPRHWGLSKRKILSPTQSSLFNLIAVISLFLIVPLRHAVFNNNGPATGILISSMALIGFSLGFVYEWKSAWCSGLCPIHPVEKFYGQNTIVPIPNAHCHQCMNCVKPCPDSTPNIHPKAATKTFYHRLSGTLIIGGLPGFIWGWFHVPDQTQFTNLITFLSVYEMPMLGFSVSFAIFLLLSNIIQARYERKMIRFFAATGVSCYYWYRLPELFGFGGFAKDGLLIDLSNSVPLWSITLLTVMVTLFFFYWLQFRKQHKNSWVIRPEYGLRKVG